MLLRERSSFSTSWEAHLILLPGESGFMSSEKTLEHFVASKRGTVWARYAARTRHALFLVIVVAFSASVLACLGSRVFSSGNEVLQPGAEGQAPGAQKNAPMGRPSRKDS